MSALGPATGQAGDDQGNGPLFAQIEFYIVQSKSLNETIAQKVSDYHDDTLKPLLIFQSSHSFSRSMGRYAVQPCSTRDVYLSQT